MTTDDSREQAIRQASDVMYEFANGGLYDPMGLAGALESAGLLAGTADTTEAEGLHAVRALAAEIDRDAARADLAALRIELAGWEKRYPCEHECIAHGSEEDCSRHGRTPTELWSIIRKAELAAVRALHAKHEHAGWPVCSIVFGGACAHDGQCTTCRMPWPCPTVRELINGGRS